jgi:3-methyladenine DNA glycosylase AlkD
MSPAATAFAPAEPESRVSVTRPAAARQTKSILDARRRRAKELGRRLETVLDDPDALSRQLRAALIELSDEPYRRELERVAPGIADVIGVRNPLIAALIGGLRPALRRARPAEALFIAERLSRDNELELRQVSLAFLRRSLADDPERTWQLMRRLGRRAADWISVDSLASLFAEGILREPFRWAEIEQLVYAESTWERRLAAATVAVLRSTARELAARGVIADRLGPSHVTRGLDVLGSLLGDAEPNVRKALSWALRELARVDRAQVTAFVIAQAERAAAEHDGNRAWVIRDALSKLDGRDADRIRERLAGIRRTHGGASTSRAAAVAGRFGRLPDPRSLPEPPL